jgi:hypothetical protein
MPIIRFFALSLLLAWPLSAQPTEHSIHVWDLALDQPGQLTIYNPGANDAEFGTPVRSGYLVVSAMARPTAPRAATPAR